MSNLPAELQFQFKDHNELSHIMEQEANNPSIQVSIDEVEDVIEDVIEAPIGFVEKPPINTKDIFISEPEPEPKPEVKEVINKNMETGESEPNFEYEGDVIEKVEVIEEPKPSNKKVTLNKNGKPRKKREYTPEQRQQMLERLAKARAQVGKTNKKKQEERAKEKEKEKKLKELKDKTRDLEIEEMEMKLKGESKPSKSSFTKEDLEQAQLNAIVSYEKIRKQRKAEKKQQQLIQKEKEALQKEVQKQLSNSWQVQAGRFSGCY